MNRFVIVTVVSIIFFFYFVFIPYTIQVDKNNQEKEKIEQERKQKHFINNDIKIICVGYKTDTSKYVTMKVYDSIYNEIGSFVYVTNSDTAKINDKYFLMRK